MCSTHTHTQKQERKKTINPNLYSQVFRVIVEVCVCTLVEHEMIWWTSYRKIHTQTERLGEGWNIGRKIWLNAYLCKVLCVCLMFDFMMVFRLSFWCDKMNLQKTHHTSHTLTQQSNNNHSVCVHVFVSVYCQVQNRKGKYEWNWIKKKEFQMNISWWRDGEREREKNTWMTTKKFLSFYVSSVRMYVTASGKNIGERSVYINFHLIFFSLSRNFREKMRQYLMSGRK